jgi:ABC-type Fe3+/spermidine/putrescine transport system ATPase subunit
VKRLSYLHVQNLSHHYRQVKALDRVSLELQEGLILALLGASGSGKSTLLAVIAGMITPQSGRVVVAGQDLVPLPPHRRKLGMVFQDYALWPHMTVKENVAFALQGLKLTRQERNLRVLKALERVGLEGLWDRRPGQLSGGQQQRVALARAIVAEPKLLLLDEPLSALDPATRNAVRHELSLLLSQLKLTTILVTHDREEAFELADRIAVIHHGTILQVGAPDDVYERPANLHVARFMGLNVLEGIAQPDGKVVLKSSGERLLVSRRAPPGPVTLTIVPEHVSIAASSSQSNQSNTVSARLLACRYSGGRYRLQLILGKGTGQQLHALSKVAPTSECVCVHLPAASLHVVEPALPSPADALSVTPLQEVV